MLCKLSNMGRISNNRLPRLASVIKRAQHAIALYRTANPEVSQAELAQRIMGSADASWVTRAMSETGTGIINNLEGIARATGVSASWLSTGLGDMISGAVSYTVNEAPGHYQTAENDIFVPVIGRAAAADGAHVDGTTDDEPPMRLRARWKAVKIHGDSGYPVVLDGQTVLVDPRLTPEANRIVVVATDRGPELKRFGGQEPDGRVILASLNAGRDPKLVRLDDMATPPLVVVGVLFSDSVAK